MNKNDTLIMTRPASWYYDYGKDSTPLGNGQMGVLIRGGVGREEIIFNRADCWHNAFARPLPDVSQALQQMRALIDKGDYRDANSLMYKRLCDAGYDSNTGVPAILGALSMVFKTTELFSNYRRILRMDRGECEVVYDQKGRHTKRRAIISRKTDTFFYDFESNEETEVILDFDVYDDHTPNMKGQKEIIESSLIRQYCDNGLDYQVKTDDLSYIVKIRIFGAYVERSGNSLRWNAKKFRVAVKCGSGKRACTRLLPPEDFDYEEQLVNHSKLHGRLYRSCDIRLGSGRARTNEALLDEAFQDKASPELIEKMWRFGRFLFISGTCKGGLPFPLYGIWHHQHHPKWAQHVANENVEIIHWHINAGGLAELGQSLIDYYYAGMDAFRENAKKLYGCKGIFIGSYTSPICKSLAVFVPVILNFTGVAGWLSQHFYRYYKMTGDKKLLTKKILPFMVAAADFYLDYLTYDGEGRVLYYPCVSPENSPKNLILQGRDQMAHPAPVTKNAVIEIAIVKELFRNLSTLIDETGQYREYLVPLQEALSRMPEYKINQDGALKEWIEDSLEDNYSHRHLSHIYPLFPGDEISKEENPEIYKAIERAVDLRELGAQSGWSLSHAASIYAALGRGDQVMEMLDTMLKGATLNNFFTLHNDYRDMGVTLSMVDSPVQLDANMGLVNAVQMMLFSERNGVVSLLPALSHRLSKGSAKNLCFANGRVSLKWDTEKQYFIARVKLCKAGKVKLILPSHLGVLSASCNGGVIEANTNQSITFSGRKGDILTIARQK